MENAYSTGNKFSTDDGIALRGILGELVLAVVMLLRVTDTNASPAPFPFIATNSGIKEA